MSITKVSFVVSDESINSHGYITLTGGIDLSRFMKNPVCLLNHERGQVIGRWENLRKEGKKLLADLVLDTSDELGRQVASKIENGFLKACSIGIMVTDETIRNGYKMVTNCELVEISIVDIPSNANAVKLKKGDFVKLSISFNNKNTMNGLAESLKKMLGLQADASEQDINSMVQKLINSVQDSQNERAESLVSQAIEVGKIKGEAKSEFVTLALNDYATAKKIIDGLPEKVDNTVKILRISEIVNTMKAGNLSSEVESDNPVGKPKSEWSLNDYRKYAPQELQKNPTLFQSLLAKFRK